MAWRRKWDVIHFNFGIHDLKFMPDGKRQVEPDDYEKNLRTLVAKLKATGAKLIWATTTPIPMANSVHSAPWQGAGPQRNRRNA